ncbi:hypothetical protein DUNSADRAFT_903 [Dunaliella salina]|uniref:ATP synthase mitochondrial F1 complex assembly factor 2 n=1 Tax=Dunaliella salina TaxID=3046 RepID=A0ABQ7H8P3_DUNSA|nr:hypothetical protein DUNSADRAFT_903 [Dunaliella salina]|eukprot:KAF5843227.1 hypothetical protein DUNSADRAFT_903 [Dunaliella salina]
MSGLSFASSLRNFKLHCPTVFEQAQCLRCFSSHGASTSAPASPSAPNSSNNPSPALAQAISAEQHRTRNRFYKTVTVLSAGEAGYQVALDSRPVKTPGRHPLILPTHPLALAIAAEWEWQKSGRPQPHTMPMMSIAAMAIDKPKPRDRLIEDLLKYAHTDVTCCRYEPGKVADRQAQMYSPLLTWAHEALGWSLIASDSIAGPSQSEQAISAVRTFLEGLDPFRLVAMEQLTATCKSIVIAAALLHGRLTPAEAFEASRLEETMQIEEWGMVEAGHDLDIAEATTRITAPSIFVRLLLQR